MSISTKENRNIEEKTIASRQLTDEEKEKVKQYIQLVYYVVNKKFYVLIKKGISIDDLAQHGMIGLILAVKYYKDKKIPFEVYATIIICRTIRSLINHDISVVSVPTDFIRILKNKEKRSSLITSAIKGSHDIDFEKLPNTESEAEIDEHENVYNILNMIEDNLHRSIIVDKIIKEKTIKEISKEVNMSKARIYSIINSTLHNLRKKILNDNE